MPHHLLKTVSLILFGSSFCWGQGTVPSEEAPPPLSPTDAAQQFEVAEGLGISLVVAEPEVSQPLSISFDDRGRMWVLQYLQFPNPNGLQPVEVDNWLRTKYDKLPEPPPQGPKGRDRISIYEDTDGDGRHDLVKHFLEDLNLASGMALGYGGVFVAQPPYLLFYPDRDRDDSPDTNPEVLLTGFGMNDAHAFANSLTWGPDGWLYGAQGSTATAEIRGIGFQQGIWRYHPRTREFELFAEGGGNTWGIDFDRFGNLFAGGNTVEPLVHHVQGAYYVKGFGKHGPLHNPHAYGYFQPVKHNGYVGDSLTGGFVLYQGGAFPSRYHNACIAPNTRHSATRWSTLQTSNSTFTTTAAGDFITTKDIWFRPVDSTIGPDGALYVADWYDYNISHSSPKNRSQWYQPSRNDGRIWRVAPDNVDPFRSKQINLADKTSRELIDLLSHKNVWFARQANRLLAERRDASLIPDLMKLTHHDDQTIALQALWSIEVSGGLSDDLAQQLLESPHDYMRAWTVRLIGDRRKISETLSSRLEQLSQNEMSVIVRSQLACTAKRLPAENALPIIRELLQHDEDQHDPHIPLLLWWAIEDKAVSDQQMVLKLFKSPNVWKQPLVQNFIIERLARRLTTKGSPATFTGCARLLSLAPDDASLDLVASGMAKASAGQQFDTIPKPLEKPLQTLLARSPSVPQVIELALRMRVASSPAFDFIADENHTISNRVAIINALGESKTIGGVDVLLRLIKQSGLEPLHHAAFANLGYYNDPRIATEVLAVYPALAPSSKIQAISLLSSRPEWAKLLLAAVQSKTIDSKSIPLTQVRQLLEHPDKSLHATVNRIWGRIQPDTPLQKQGRISAITQLLNRRKGNVSIGAKLFEKTCATCHKLHGKGTVIGPDLTASERKDRLKLIHNIVDPSAEIRPQYLSYVAATKKGRVVTGVLADSTASTVTLLDAKNKRTILNRTDLEELRESPVSLMPEKILKDFTDQQIRDLIAYIQSPGLSAD